MLRAADAPARSRAVTAAAPRESATPPRSASKIRYVCFVIVLPLFHGNDERTHADRMWALTDGHFFCATMPLAVRDRRKQWAGASGRHRRPGAHARRRELRADDDVALLLVLKSSVSWCGEIQRVTARSSRAGWSSRSRSPSCCRNRTRHVDYAVGSHLHHPHDGHCDDHGPMRIAKA
jgi:hypothetical protein